MDLRPAGISDCLLDTISYTDIYRIVKEVVEGKPQNLLETVAQLIASTTLTKHPRISAVRVQVQKPHVSVPGHIDFLGVEITRYRSVLTSQFPVILTSWVLKLPDTEVLKVLKLKNKVLLRLNVFHYSLLRKNFVSLFHWVC